MLRTILFAALKPCRSCCCRRRSTTNCSGPQRKGSGKRKRNVSSLEGKRQSPFKRITILKRSVRTDADDMLVEDMQGRMRRRKKSEARADLGVRLFFRVPSRPPASGSLRRIFSASFLTNDTVFAPVDHIIRESQLRRHCGMHVALQIFWGPSAVEDRSVAPLSVMSWRSARPKSR